MDKESKDYLDKRFDQAERRTREIVAEATHQIVAEATRQIVGETTRQITALSEKVDTEIRHTRVLIEDLRSDLKAVAEGVVNVNEKLDRHLESWERQRHEDQAANRLVFSHHRDRLTDHETRISKLEARPA